MEAEDLKTSILSTIDDLNQYLQGKATALDIINAMKGTINDVDDYATTIRENKTMKNLNEGKKKASAYMAELAEIDKQSAVVAMEAKINKLAEMVEAKTQRLSMVSEDENLSELIDKKRVKMMEREIKEIERAKLKLEKLYEKMTGGKKKEMVDEEMDDKINPGNTEDDQAKKDDYDYDARPAHMKEGGYGSTTYEEDDSTYEEDDMKESTNEEYLRMQKLAGVISEEEYKNRLNINESVKLSDIMVGDKFKGGIFLNPSMSYRNKNHVEEYKLNPVKIKKEEGRGDSLVLSRGGKMYEYSIDNGVVEDLIYYEEALKGV
jgi:hypothetical protein